MAPSGRTAANNNTSKTKTPTSKTRRRTRQQRKTHFKKKQQQQEITSSSVLPTCCSSISSSQDSTKEKEQEDMENISEVIDVTNNSSACSTPKGQKFRIPEISTCPPAPKKPTRVLSNCSLRRSPLSFFAPPDLEHFFLAALRDVPV